MYTSAESPEQKRARHAKERAAYERRRERELKLAEKLVIRAANALSAAAQHYRDHGNASDATSCYNALKLLPGHLP